MDIYPDSAKTWELLIGGVDYTAVVQRESLRVQDSEGTAVDTLQCAIADLDNAFEFTPVMSVKWRADDVTVFGGQLQSADWEPNQGWQYHVWRLQAVSWWDLVRRTETTPRLYKLTNAGAVLQALFTDFGLTGFDTETHVEMGPVLETFTVGTGSLADALEVLAAEAGGFFLGINGDAQVLFHAEVSNEAPFEVGEISLCNYYDDGNIYPLDRDGYREGQQAQQFYNRVVVDLGEQAGDVREDEFTGDGAEYLFVLSARPVNDVIHVLVAGEPRRFGQKLYDTIGLENVECLIDYAGGALYFAPGEPPAGGAQIVIRYRAKTRLTVVRTSAAGYALAGENWLTTTIRNSAITTQEQAEAIADAILEQFGDAFATTGRFSTRRLGLAAGQRVTIHLPAALGGTVTRTIRSVTYEWDPGRVSVICRAEVGSREQRLSDFLARSLTQPALAQPTIPRLDFMIGVQHVSDRIEILQPGTVFEWSP